MSIDEIIKGEKRPVRKPVRREPPPTPEEHEKMVLQRIELIADEIDSLCTDRARVSERIKNKRAEKKQWERLLPRRRKPKD